jgi:BirA family biotin operon repressor/biotin-[acetyl-CoA-carboxylase] ligase
MQTPDPARLPLDRARLAALDGVVMPGVRVEVLDTAESTNAEATARALAGAPEGTVVVAEHQTAGRGRLARTWETPPGTGLTFSVVLRPAVPLASWPWLPLLTGQAVRKALRAIGFDAGLKWPNDVLIPIEGVERKVAGILVERIETPTGPAAIVGIGVNVAMSAEELPVPEAGSLALARPDAVPGRTGVLLMILTALMEGYLAWEAGGPEAEARLAASYAGACVTLGRDVAVAMPDGSTLSGRAESIDPSGRLVVRPGDSDPDCAPVHVGAGDVVPVRVQ